MNFLFTPNHLQLLNACYPPTSSLLTAGPEYAPNAQEVSRLTYYASNNPSKLNKLGCELEKRVRIECRKARAGNLRTRASLLISLSIFRSLATECRHNIALLSPALIASLNVTLAAVPSDIEVVARVAGVFSIWTTFTDGHLIGADSHFTNEYLALLTGLSALCCIDMKDHEVRNRTRLIGFAAITGALNSEALYNDSRQFKAQISILMRPILLNLFQTDMEVLEQQAENVKDDSISPYLAEFRTRPAIERRAASIHIHIDGDKGPSADEVSGACLRALYSLLEHVNGYQLGQIMRSSFDNIEALNSWSHTEQCCWFALKAAEWAQYQYRYAVPTLLVDRFLEGQDTPKSSAMYMALGNMVATVFNSSIPVISLATSDILSNLMAVVVRRTATDAKDELLPVLVNCISSLGRHVYYSDQIQDLSAEIITRLIHIETHGVLPSDHPAYTHSRSEALRCLVSGLLGLMHAAGKNETLASPPNGTRKRSNSSQVKDSPSTDNVSPRDGSSSRTRISPDTWQESLSLLCDEDYAVRVDYAEALIFYLTKEMPRLGDMGDTGPKRARRVLDSIQGVNMNVLVQTGDEGTKFLHAIHAYLFTLASSTSLGITTTIVASGLDPAIIVPAVNVLPATPQEEATASPSEAATDTLHADTQPPERPSTSQAIRSRKVSLVCQLFEQAPSQISSSAVASISDYAAIHDVLVTIHEQLPVRGLLTGVPMLLALAAATSHSVDDSPQQIHRINTVKAVVAKVWINLGKTWDIPELVETCENALSSAPGTDPLESVGSPGKGRHHPPRQPTPFASSQANKWDGVDSEQALVALISNRNVQEVTGLDQASLLRRFSLQWSPAQAHRSSVEKTTFDATIRGDGVSPLLKISPALMQIENISMQSLARSTRAVGVTDLREALEGRHSMSNTALVSGRPGSISTFDHASSLVGSDSRLSRSRSRTRSTKKRVISGPNEVRDVLNKLGIGKQNGSLLKSSFPVVPKPEHGSPPYKS